MAYILCTLFLSSFSGCETSRGAKIDYPVVGPPPPRYSNSDSNIDHREYAKNNTSKDTEIIPASSTGIDSRSPELEIDMEVVAVVNGKQVIAGEVLEPYTNMLKQVKTKASPQEFEMGRKQLIEKELKTYIERTVLLQKLNQSMKKEQMKALNEQVDKVFTEHAQSMMTNAKVSNTQELDEFLRNQGTSLQQIKTAFGNQQLALFYMGTIVDKPRIVGHPEMEAWYQEHINEYKTPARVRWQELSVSYKEHGSKQDAAQHMFRAITALKNNTPFEIVIKEFSDGVTKDKNGIWDWTQRDSIADETFAGMLFEIPLNKISDVYQGASSFKIFKVIERENEKTSPFGEKQDDIRAAILANDRESQVQTLLEKLISEADIQTKYNILQNDKKDSR